MILKEKPQIIFHLASIKRIESYKTPLSTINSNVLGTANRAIKFSNTVKSLVIATTDKVYLNFEEKTFQ